jgi:hypothetical protein
LFSISQEQNNDSSHISVKLNSGENIMRSIVLASYGTMEPDKSADGMGMG